MVAAASLLSSAGSAVAADAFTFTDPLSGPSSPYLTLVPGKFSYTPAGLLRSQSDSGSTNNLPPSGSYDRPLNKTISGAFLGRDFDFQITVTSPHAPATEDIIFIGLGSAVQNPSYYNEVTNAAEFRIHNLNGYWGIHAALPHGFNSDPWATSYIQEIGTFDPAGMTFRIARSGDVLTMEIVGVPSSLRTFSVSSDLWFLSDPNTYFFFGNTAEGTVFSNLVLSSAPIGGGDPTPVDCVVQSAGYGACTAACGGGTSTEILQVLTPASNGGAACRAPVVFACNTQACDTDGDGVADSVDQCPGTAPGAHVNANGCSGAQLVARGCSPVAVWKNHGDYVSCVAKASNSARAAGLLTDAERSTIQRAAAQSSIGK